MVKCERLLCSALLLLWTAAKVSAAGSIRGKHQTQSVNASTSVASRTLLAPDPENAAIRLNVGGQDYMDTQGRLWKADNFSGNAAVNACSITNSEDDDLYCSKKWFGSGQTPATLSIPVPHDGEYTVRLHFAETHFGAEGKRVFNVLVGNETVAADFDVVASAGAADTAYILETALRSKDKSVSITLATGSVNNPMLSAVEVVPTEIPPDTEPPETVPPDTESYAVRINVGGGTFTDEFGRVWEADSFSRGNSASMDCTDSPIAGTQNDPLYCSYQWYRATEPVERSIPVESDGEYKVRLHFAETHFTSSGKRSFNVFVENLRVVQNLDVVAAAGGARTAYVVEASATASNKQVSITLEKGLVNNPMLSAIEVIKLPVESYAIHMPVDESYAIRINVAGEEYTDPRGRVWRADDFSAGNEASLDICSDSSIANTDSDLLYCAFQWYRDTTTRNIPVPYNGEYTVRLHFAEVHFPAAGSRAFNVLVQNELVAENLDVALVSGGARTAYTLETLVGSSDFNISITLAKGLINNPMLSAIEIIFNGTPPEPPQCGVPRFLGSEWTNTAGTNLAYPIMIGEAHGGMIGNDFVITGGYFEGVKNATCQTYALDTTDPSSEWRRMDDCQIELGVTHAATVVVGTKLFLIGGYLGGNLGSDGIGQEIADVLVYDHSKPRGKQWSRLPNLPEGRAGGGAFYCSTNNALVFGAGAIRPNSGQRYAVDKPETWMYSFDNPAAGWMRKADALFLANHMQYVDSVDSTGKGRHYFVGGQEGMDEHYDNVPYLAEYDFGTDTWTPRADMPIPRSHATSSTRAYGCGFLIISGTTNGAVRTQDISYYEPETDTWTYVGDLPKGLNTPVCVIAKIEGSDWVLCETGWTTNHYSYRREIVRVDV